MFSTIYYTLIQYPIYNTLIALYNVIPGHDLGVAIILLTIFIQLILFPLRIKGQEAQRKGAAIQGEMQKVKEQFKNNKEGQQKALMELYQREGFNPLSGCLPMIFQLAVMIGLFLVFREIFNPEQYTNLYRFVSRPESIRPVAFGFLDLSAQNLWLGAMAAVAQFFQTKIMMRANPQPAKGGSDFARSFQLSTLYVFPVILFVFSFQFPASLMLYWTTLSVLGILQDALIAPGGTPWWRKSA